MKIRRLRLESFKRFRSSLELVDLHDGLNLFVAPNESGKSTVAEAIRTAFFERHRSTALERLRPWGDSTATPTVEIEFELGSQPARLVKTFLGRKRCELTIGAEARNGEAAEDHLGHLLGFGFAGRGANAPRHMGVPGLLWIQQGTSHEISEAVEYAAQHLRSALGNTLGELAATSGDAVLRAVEAERDQLLTPATSAPRGDYLLALRRCSELEQGLASLQRDIDTYRSDVDRLASLRRAHQQDSADRPWERAREQLATAQAVLAEGRSLEGRKAAQDAVVQQAAVQVDTLLRQLQLMEREEQALQGRKARLATAQEQLQLAQTQLQTWEPQQAAAVQADALARQQLHVARQAAMQAAYASNAEELCTQVTALQQRLDRAQAEHDRLAQLGAQAQALALPPGALGQLRACCEAVRAVQLRLDAVSTALELQLLPGAAVTVAGAQVTGVQRLGIAARTAIEIGGVGRITVLPGGEDLDSLASERERQHARQQAMLQGLGVESLAAAEERERRREQLISETRAVAAALAAHAPDGLAALAAETVAQTARLAQARQNLAAAAPPAHADAPTLSIAQAESQEASARDALVQAGQELGNARNAVILAAEKMQAAREELHALQATLSEPGRVEQKTLAERQLTEARAHQSAAQAEAGELGRQLQRVNLPMLQQDVERFAQSAQQAQATHAHRANDIIRLEAELKTRGALGLEELTAQAQLELEQAQRRCSELTRRAKALDHLFRLLRHKRAELARRLHAPLQAHLNHYLHILFPGASVEVGEDLAPGRITRLGASSAESGAFDELSLGTREQMGVVARLAYADLLKAAGRPTLLILDDALVNTDQERLGQMKRVLYDAASRHQILVLSCHPQAWQDLGVAARNLV